MAAGLPGQQQLMAATATGAIVQLWWQLLFFCVPLQVGNWGCQPQAPCLNYTTVGLIQHRLEPISISYFNMALPSPRNASHLHKHEDCSVCVWLSVGTASKSILAPKSILLGTYPAGNHFYTPLHKCLSLSAQSTSKSSISYAVPLNQPSTNTFTHL